MDHKEQTKSDIIRDIGELSKIIHLLSLKYRQEPLMKHTQKVFLRLSVHVGKALDISLQ